MISSSSPSVWSTRHTGLGMLTDSHNYTQGFRLFDTDNMVGIVIDYD